MHEFPAESYAKFFRHTAPVIQQQLMEQSGILTPGKRKKPEQIPAGNLNPCEQLGRRKCRYPAPGKIFHISRNDIICV